MTPAERYKQLRTDLDARGKRIVLQTDDIRVTYAPASRDDACGQSRVIMEHRRNDSLGEVGWHPVGTHVEHPLDQIAFAGDCLILEWVHACESERGRPDLDLPRLIGDGPLVIPWDAAGDGASRRLVASIGAGVYDREVDIRFEALRPDAWGVPRWVTGAESFWFPLSDHSDNGPYGWAEAWDLVVRIEAVLAT
jgi:hypothetical protein